MAFNKITEADSYHNNLEKKSIAELLQGMHQEDQKAVQAVGKVLPQVEQLIAKVTEQLQNGGRLFYIGAGTSGRLGVLDASECPPTFGTPPEKVIGLIAGGDHALRNSIEKAEDDTQQAWKDLKEQQISTKDIVVGIAASGTTPYVVGGLDLCKQHGIPTACITCNNESPLAAVSDFPVEVIVGPEFLTGSSRLKAGTAQKLILNMITTSTMIQLGHVKGNKMVDMQLTNDKLTGRAERMLMNELQVSLTVAQELLKQHHIVRAAISAYQKASFLYSSFYIFGYNPNDDKPK